MIRWQAANFAGREERSSVGVFDRVVAVETLQYTDFSFGCSQPPATGCPGRPLRCLCQTPCARSCKECTSA
jgi:hypothetical protein